MNTRNSAIVIAILAAVTIAYTANLWPILPAQIPIHWNINGQVDGWATKAMAAGMWTATIAVLGLMLIALPWLSPRSFSLEPFRRTFNYVLVILAFMMLGIQVLSLQAALHPGSDSGKPLITLLFVFFALIGNVLGKTRRNFYMGYRCPWTLASDTVWVATHRLGGTLMFVSGILGAVAVWLGVPFSACFAVFLVAVLIPYVYALALYKKLEREGKAPDSTALDA